MNFALGRLRDPTDDFQQRAFAGSVFTDYPDYFAWLDIKRDIPERPKIRIRTFLSMISSIWRHGRAVESMNALIAVCFILDEVAISISESCYDGQQ